MLASLLSSQFGVFAGSRRPGFEEGLVLFISVGSDNSIPGGKKSSKPSEQRRTPNHLPSSCSGGVRGKLSVQHGPWQGADVGGARSRHTYCFADVPDFQQCSWSPATVTWVPVLNSEDHFFSPIPWTTSNICLMQAARFPLKFGVVRGLATLQKRPGRPKIKYRKFLSPNSCYFIRIMSPRPQPR